MFSFIKLFSIYFWCTCSDQVKVLIQKHQMNYSTAKKLYMPNEITKSIQFSGLWWKWMNLKKFGTLTLVIK